MEQRIERTAFAWSDRAWRVLERARVQLDAALRRLGLQHTHLDGSFLHQDDGTYEASLVLTLPDRQLSVIATMPEPVAAVRGAVADLGRQLDAFRLEIDTPLRHRVLARKGASRPDLGMWDETFRQAFEREGLPAITRHAEHELAVAQAEGTLDPGWLEVSDLVDEAVLETLPEIRVADGMEAAVFLVQDKVNELLELHAEEMAAERERRSSLWSDAPVSPVAEVGGFGDEVQAFWAIDNALHLDDVLADPGVVGAEDLVEDHEVRHVLVQALLALPSPQRRLFEAVVMDGWTQDTVAHVRALDTSKVRDAVDDALATLRGVLAGKLVDDPAQVRSLYEALGRQLHEERLTSAAGVGVLARPWSWGQ